MIMQSTPNSRRREKPILSCTFCRGRKLRCDRQSPCGACLQRRKALECIYRTPEQERRDAIDYRPRGRSQQARQRIARLENLVLEMRDRDIARSVQNSSNDRPPPSVLPVSDSGLSAPPSVNLADDLGKLSFTDDHPVYTGSSHWVTILEDIRRLKDELSQEGEEPPASSGLEPTSFHPSLMLGSPATKFSLLNSAACLSKEQILAMVPPRKVVDRHISHFFNAFDVARYIVHRKQFLAEYAKFWDNPPDAPIMWVGLMFSLMSMAVFLQDQDIGGLGLSSAESRRTQDNYRRATIHCLLTGDYLRPSRYTVETLIVHFAVDHNVNIEPSIGNWILIGVVIRIAMRVGLHRDPSHWPDIGPLQAEIRRRLWMTLYQMDFFTSTQVGLPRIVNDSQCDTRLPAHLMEQDLDFEDREMPPERSLSEPSALLYLIQRGHIVRLAAEIYDLTEAGPPSPSAISSLSARIQRVADGIPAWLKYRPLEASIADDTATMLHQILLDILIHKATYLLHRRSFVKVSSGDENTELSELCVKAALAILDHQRRISEETQPGGMLYNIRWKVSSALNHEFIQATMMLCYALSRCRGGYGQNTMDISVTPDNNSIVAALTNTKSLWDSIRDQSSEARRAANAIAAILQLHSDRLNVQTALPVSDGEQYLGTMPDLPADHARAAEFFGHLPGVAEQSYYGTFDYGQNMALDAIDPSFFAVDRSMAEFGGMLDDFSSGQGSM